MYLSGKVHDFVVPCYKLIYLRLVNHTCICSLTWTFVFNCTSSASGKGPNVSTNIHELVKISSNCSLSW